MVGTVASAPSAAAPTSTRITLAVSDVGDASGASLSALLRYIYTEQFDPESLTGRGGALSLLRLTTRFESAGSSVCLERLRQLCEAELAAAAVPETLVATAHEASDLGADQLLQYCLHAMRAQFDLLHSRGEIVKLKVALCAELLALRSKAPVQDALAYGRADVAAWLIDQKESDEGIAAVKGLLAVVDASGRTALEVALLNDEFDAAARLVSKGAPVDAMAAGGDESLLHSICYVFRTHTLRKLTLLLEARANVDMMNGRGESALDVAFFHGGPEVVSLLLKYKARSTMTTAEGGCLLHQACLLRRSEVLQAACTIGLKTIGVDLNQQDARGLTPLHLAVSSGERAGYTSPLYEGEYGGTI